MSDFDNDVIALKLPYLEPLFFIMCFSTGYDIQCRMKRAVAHLLLPLVWECVVSIMPAIFNLSLEIAVAVV